MTVEVRIELDTRQLVAWADQTTKAMRRQLQSAVDKSARYARAKTVKVIAADARVPLARMRKAMPLVQSGRGGETISATWTVGKANNSIRSASGEVAYTRGTPIEASTFALTGGGSASLELPHGFVISANGGRIVVTRTGKGRDAFKAVYAESPATAMAQADSVPRKTWQRSAEDAASLRIPAAVTAALQGSSVEPSAGRFATSGQD